MPAQSRRRADSSLMPYLTSQAGGGFRGVYHRAAEGGTRRLNLTLRMRRGLRHIEARDGAAANVVHAGIDDAFALDLDQHRLGELAAIELAQAHGEVGAFGVPGNAELRSELDLCGPLRTADGDAPAPLVRRCFHRFGQFRPQLVRGLRESQ